jgi:hypothetical protein
VESNRIQGRERLVKGRLMFLGTAMQSMKTEAAEYVKRQQKEGEAK